MKSTIFGFSASSFSFWHLTSDVWHLISSFTIFLSQFWILYCFFWFLWNFRCMFLSIVHFCPKLVMASLFWHKCQRALYFFPNFEQFTIVWFSLNLWCLSLSQLSIVNFGPKLVVSPLVFDIGAKELCISPLILNTSPLSDVDGIGSERLFYYCFYSSVKNSGISNFLFRFSTMKTCLDLDKFWPRLTLCKLWYTIQHISSPLIEFILGTHNFYTVP